jgi:hypothetical protein
MLQHFFPLPLYWLTHITVLHVVPQAQFTSTWTLSTDIQGDGRKQFFLARIVWCNKQVKNHQPRSHTRRTADIFRIPASSGSSKSSVRLFNFLLMLCCTKYRLAAEKERGEISASPWGVILHHQDDTPAPPPPPSLSPSSLAYRRFHTHVD